MSNGLEHTEDIFDSAINLESSQLQKGFEDGYKDGIEAGKVEGREVGLKVGFQQGEELGFYQGCINIWKAVIAKCPSHFSTRSQKSILLLEEQLIAYPLNDHNNERRQDMLEMLRARFRAILAMLSTHIHYDGYPGLHTEENTTEF